MSELELFTFKQVAAMLKTSVDFVRDEVAQERFEVVSLGYRTKRIPRESYESYVASRRGGQRQYAQQS